MNLSQLLAVNAESYGDKEAIIQGKRRFTWELTYKRTNKLTNFFLEMGISKGEKGGILLHNCPEYVETVVALQRINAIPVPIHSRFSVPELKRYVEYCDISLIVTSTDFKDMIEELPDIEKWIIAGKNVPRNLTSYDALMKDASLSEEEPEVIFGGEEIAIMFPTAGTTGTPKPTLLSHDAIEAILEIIPSYGIIPEEIPIRVGEMKFLIPAPIYHVAGFMPMITQIAMKSALVFPSTPKFDPEEICEIIEKEKIEACFMVPTMYKKLLDYEDLDKYDLASLELITSGASKMPVGLKKAILEKFPHGVLIDGYGSSETMGGVTISVLTRDDIPEIEDGYIGKPYPGVEVKIVDETGREQELGKPGELAVKSPSILSGYYKDPEKSSQVLKNGWYYTGDICKMDEEGNIYYVGREDDVINTGGEKVYRTEVEQVLEGHPNVEEAAVLGVPDPLWGEKVKGVVKLKSGKTATSKEILEFCEGKIAKFKIPKKIEFTDNIPRTEDGKIILHKVKELFE